MCDEENSSQVKSWLFTFDLLKECREKANRKARHAIIENQINTTAKTKNNTIATPIPCVSSTEVSSSTTETAAAADNGGPDISNATTTNDSPLLPVGSFASGYTIRQKDGIKDTDDNNTNNIKIEDEWNIPISNNPLLSSNEEQLLIQFYAGKLPSLIGPNATISRLRRDVKVLATAALLFRRFFLSNSVMLHDPKCIMVASAFLGSKVEDATVDIRYLEEGTKLMQAPVSTQEILDAEVSLIAGVDFDLMCFHPYKAVLAFTEDLRTYLKSDKGKKLVSIVHAGGGGEGAEQDQNYTISGEDLRPIHDQARHIIDDVCVSDIPLLYTPGQIGLAAMMVVNQKLVDNVDNNDTRKLVPQIDFYGYIQNRFQHKQKQNKDVSTVIDENKKKQLYTTMSDVTSMLKELRNGKYGCGNHGIDMNVLKGVHKKLKKCRVWVGEESHKQSSEDNAGKKKKKKKKRKAPTSSSGDNAEVDSDKNKKMEESSNE